MTQEESWQSNLNEITNICSGLIPRWWFAKKN